MLDVLFQVFNLAMFLGLILLGVLLCRGKCIQLIAGYNTMSPEAKAKIDEKALGRFVGKLMFFVAGCYVAIALGGLLDNDWLLALGIWAIIIGMFAALIWANVGKRFQRKE